MKIFPYVDFKEKKDRKAFFLSLLTFVVISQLVGLVYSLLFDESIFISLLFSSIAGFIFGYKGRKERSNKKE